MRSSVVLVLLTVLVGVLLTMQWLGIFADADVPIAPAAPGAAPANRQTTATPPHGGGGDLGAGLVATRNEPAPAPSAGLADAPSACLQVVDHATGNAIAGAPIRRVQGGIEIAFTDERGLAPVALRAAEQLAVVVDGYLLRLVPTHLGSTEAEPQTVRMVRDEWSIVRRFEFATDSGAVTEAFVRFRPRTSTKGAPSPVPAGDPQRQRAWTEHTMLAALPVCADVPVQLGSWAEDRVHRLANGADVRFLAAGELTLEVATTTGFVARTEVRIEATPRTGAPPIRLRLAPGAFVTGTVVGVVSTTPVAGARVTLQGGEPLGLVATTANDGTFRFGPLLAGEITLHARHGDHEPLAFGPLAAPAAGVRIALTPLPHTTLRGRVRARPSERPIAGAHVTWAPAGSAPATAVTAEDGTFTLRATGGADARLAVQAIGYLPYAELVRPDAAFADYDLWPATTVERLGAGLSALLEGIVVDGSGRPVADVDVRWHPAQRAAPVGVPGRRVLEGAALELALGARTGADGAFRLETNDFGAGRLALAGSSPDRGLDVVATAGQTKNGLRLQQ